MQCVCIIMYRVLPNTRKKMYSIISNIYIKKHYEMTEATHAFIQFILNNVILFTLN